jgi:hypothetical protein
MDRFDRDIGQEELRPRRGDARVEARIKEQMYARCEGRVEQRVGREGGPCR